MKTIKHDNPTIVHDVNHDFVCPKENFGKNPKMFLKYACEYDNWSPNEHMN